MTHEEIRELIAIAHRPELTRESHVMKLWEDGEVTSEKGGPLYGSRTVHKIEYGTYEISGAGDALPTELFPEVLANQHSYLISDRVGVYSLRRLLWPELPEVGYDPPPRAGEVEKPTASKFADMNARRRALVEAE